MKDKLKEDLLKMHCELCTGKVFGCKGCNKEDRIKGIIDLYIREPKVEEVQKEVKEEVVEEQPKKRKTKKS